MGAGGQKTFPRSEEEEKQQQAAAVGFKRIPTTKPPFTLSDLRKAIPPHCFQRSLLRSFSYVFIDLTIISILGYIAATYIYLLPPPSKYLAWLLYWAVQGCFFTGAWALAHDCGHHAFSDYQWVDDAVGMVLHSTLMVPYFSFKYSHRRHHSNINSLERDEVFVPRPKSEIKWYCSKYLNNPLGRVLTLAVTLILGWPMYLAFNASGRDYDRFVSHFYPYGPIYNDRERLQIYISDAGIFIVSYVLYQVALAKGLPWLICIYSVPLFVNNALVVTITYLQHTHPELPRYSNSEWDWFKGTLATVDRDMGPLLNWVTHHVSDTHYVHHLFSTMPHYHGVEATKAVKQMLGEYYRFDPTPLYKALWREAKECLFVESESKSPGVFWFHKF